MRPQSYVIISACRNEADYIEGLIDTIAAQSHLPLKWLIVDDGSTDDTIVRAVSRGRDIPFVQVVQMSGGRPRSFSSQVYAAQHGAELVRSLSHNFIGFLDADIRLGPDYFERLLAGFTADAKLGLAGGVVIDQYADRQENIRKGSEETHVAGGVQFFRRECFEEVGGYMAIDGGGQDTIADVMAMMHGWGIRSFPDLPAIHLRPDGFAKENVLRRGLKWGRKFYLLGYDPLFYLGQCARRVFRRPFLIGSVCQLYGFLVAMAKGGARPVSADFVRFLRAKQRQRLWDGLRGLLRLRKESPSVGGLGPEGGCIKQ